MLCVALLGATPVSRQVRVCASGCDYATIQAAVDASDAGDTILLEPEFFAEHVRIVDKDLTIRGAGASATIVDGSGQNVVFEVLNRPERSFELSHLTIQNGLVGVQGGGTLYLHDCVVRENSPGGGVVSFSGANLTVDHCVVEHNRGNYGGGVAAGGESLLRHTIARDNVAIYGGGVGVGGTTELDHSLLQGNTANEIGGGLVNRFGTVRITRTEISSNSAVWGGGIYNDVGTVDVAFSAIVGNNAQYAAGAFSSLGVPPCGVAGAARLTFTASTISGNSAVAYGSAIYGTGEVVARSTTIADNQSVQGASLSTWPDFCPNTFRLGRTLLGDNQGDNCDASIQVVSEGFNLSDDRSCGLADLTDLNGLDPYLGPLQDNGGPTPTHALERASPAVDAAGGLCEPTDQRGVSRPFDGNDDGRADCDIGAFELAPLPLQLTIDVRPSGSADTLNPRSRGLVRVALLGDGEFDVSQVDLSTLRFGPGQARPAHRLDDPFVLTWHQRDTNNDGFIDLLSHYRIQDAGITCGMTSVTLTGRTAGDLPFAGSGALRTVGCRGSGAQP